ncbi:epiphycan [Hylobates moloch]|uniref:Epiphycan n=1 Tax=Nomascus leucogenys TaxID=61853 RepID=G1R0N2_NOMLE|nr:epiphycan [Hylobates moloch]XP_055094301.1 epiphycan [Symphalangus syndactylus]XP_055094302.1 epiphycan [Symphalangus syndactylus]
MKTLARIVLGLVIFDAAVTAPTLESINYDSETYDATLEDLDNLYNYENIPVDQVEIEIATVMPSGNRELLTPPPQPEEAQEEEEEEESTPRLIDGSSPQEPEFTGVLGPHTNEDFPTCLLCTCISTTVYCDDHELDAIPPLPKNTAYFYSRFNRIKKINKNDFASLSDLRRIDLTSNLISEIDEDAFRKLPQLRELVLRDNKIRQLPELPITLTFIDISNNRLGRKGIKQEAFKDMYDLHHLYLTDNNLDHIPLPLPENLQALHLQNNNILEMHEDTFCNVKNLTYIRKALEDIRLDGNPINLSKTPQAYTCLPRLPVGSLV